MTGISKDLPDFSSAVSDVDVKEAAKQAGRDRSFFINIRTEKAFSTLTNEHNASDFCAIFERHGWEKEMGL